MVNDMEKHEQEIAPVRVSFFAFQRDALTFRCGKGPA